MEHLIDYLYVTQGNERFFTVVLLPHRDGKFPIVVCRSPYVKGTVSMNEREVAQSYYEGMKLWLERGYAVVFQHCRGCGKSSGVFVPYVDEHEDGQAFRAWIRRQPFYNGELFLLGSSYTSSLHYAASPFEDDVKGAVFEVQDSERYRLWYRNGQMRKGHANWHFGLYKDTCGLNKQFGMQSFSELPLSGLSNRVLGDCAEDFEQMLDAYRPDHPFWDTRFGGGDARDAVSHCEIPVLLTTGYNDYYIGGVFRMWERMNQATKEKSAVLVSPYNHGDGYHKEHGVAFPNGKRKENFGNDYQIAWFDHIRTGSPIPFQKGSVNYYRAFAGTWGSDFYKEPTQLMSCTFGEGMHSFVYDPANPPAFLPEGYMAELFDGRHDVVTLYTNPFAEDVFVKGQMKLRLCVSSDCEDTAFYVRISLKKKQYTYVLRHDITSLCYQLDDYTVGDFVDLEFSFDEYAYLILAGEQLRIDISSTDDNTYVCHTNQKGDYARQTRAIIATNQIDLDRSRLILPTASLSARQGE